MATYSFNTTGSITYFPDNISASQAVTWSITESQEGTSYFTLETFPNQDGQYDASSQKSTSGSFTYDSGITNVVYDDYKMSAVVKQGGGQLYFVPSGPVTGSNLRVRGVGGKLSYDTLLDRWPNAAAAYSLRLLNSYYEGPAVRVRRSIDNEETNIGFNPVELDTTALTNFATNAGTALPVDYGDGAAAAYSLRYVSSTYSGPIIKVRRDSDNNEANFTPSEITDGTLEAWVNEDVVTYTSNFSSGFDGVNPQKFTGEFNVDGVEGVNDTLKLTLRTGNEEWWSQRPSTFVAGNTYTITLDIYIPSSNTLVDNVRIGSTGNGTDVGTVNTVGAWTTATFNFTAVSSTLGIRAYDGNSGYFAGNGTDHFYVKNIQVTQTTSNGFVTTWYDQSGNGNDATQTTAANQPQIVSNGSVITENGKPALNFDGTNDAFIASSVNESQPTTFFTVAKRDVTTGGKRNLFDGLTSRQEAAISSFSPPVSNFLGNTAFFKGGLATTNQELQMSLFNGASSEIYINGTLDGSGDPGIGAITSLGIGRDIDASDHFDGKYQELILYPSNQSTNRIDIESNINNYYNIFPFDAYVTTWYDQSGNGRNATQTTAANQPQIVSSGSVILENGKPSLNFDGVDDYFSSNITGFKSISNLSTFFISTPVSAAAADINTFVPWGFGNFNTRVLAISSATSALSGETITIAFEDGSVRRLGSSTYSRGSNQQSLLSSYHLSTGTSIYSQGNQITLNLATGLTTSSAAAPVNTGYTSDDTVFINAVRASNTIIPSPSSNHQEFLFYPSNQSTNRTGIESNINSHYKIY